MDDNILNELNELDSLEFMVLIHLQRLYFDGLKEAINNHNPDDKIHKIILAAQENTCKQIEQVYEQRFKADKISEEELKANLKFMMSDNGIVEV